ncbi:MAG: RNase J family beta-CASP ribonuclease [Candidatus Woesearchaeota archaeon]|nr:MAG: RNase J family beta-CASP ribonuclease [Candidatus Woesearchaeota archaeon]
MAIKIHSVGGFEEIGRNMTCVEYEDEAVILDMGLYLDKYISVQDNSKTLTANQLIQEDAIPNPDYIRHIEKKVIGIVLSHAHLDHIGAVPWIAKRYNCPIIATPYTIEIVKSILKDHKKKLSNEFIPLNSNSSYPLSSNITIELVNVTHSLPQAAMIHVKTPEGNIVYTGDYKFDYNPIIGKRTNKKRLKQIGKENVLALMPDSTRADEERKTYSETVARQMLKDVLLDMETQGHGIILTTFSSHIARLKSMLELGQELGREVVFVGRSLKKYIDAAEKLKIVKFSNRAEIIPSARFAKKRLQEINKIREKYVLIMTGNQGEPDAILTRVVKDELSFNIFPEDFVVFSCITIPTPIIQANRRVVERILHNKKARIFKDVHVSGHASREDHRDLIKILKPKHVIPCHGDMNKRASLAKLANEMGYKMNKGVHLLQNGQNIVLS